MLVRILFKKGVGTPYRRVPSQKALVFTPLFHPRTSKVTNIQLHNWPFTTANYILQLQKLSTVARF